MNEVQRKLQNLRAAMSSHELKGLRFKSVDWFSWITAGGSNVVIFTQETGVAEVFITQSGAWILTNRIERERLLAEEIPTDFEVVDFPWQDSEAADSFVDSILQGAPCATDRPLGLETELPWSLRQMRLRLQPEEVERYRHVGRQAAEAMTEALLVATPDWTENRLAGEGARSLWKRGLDPTLVLVGGESRVSRFRHPTATDSSLGGMAMMVFCARGFGLYANLTRFVFFRHPTEEELGRFQQVAQVEALAFEHSRPGRELRSLYETLAQAYAQLGMPEEIHRHHQGGPTGYLSREFVASSNSPPSLKIEGPCSALAWNPSLPGAKIEDTVLTTASGLEILTVDPQWPTFKVAGRSRPDVWIQHAKSQR